MLMTKIFNHYFVSEMKVVTKIPTFDNKNSKELFVKMVINKTIYDE